MKSGLTAIRETTISIPYATPVTIGSVDVWAVVEYDIADCDVRTDTEYLDIVPTDRFQAVLGAMIDLGFTFQNAECVATPPSEERPVVQRLEFTSIGSSFAEEFDTLELFLRTRLDVLTLGVTVDEEDSGPSPSQRDDDSEIEIRSIEHAKVRSRLQSLVGRTGAK